LVRRPPPPGTPDGRAGTRLVLIIAIAVAIVVFAASISPIHLDDVGWARIVSGGIMLTLIAARLAVSRKALSGMAGHAAIWLAIGAVLVAGYSFKDEIDTALGRAAGTVVPSHGAMLAQGTMRYTADNDGQFTIDGTVNGTKVRFLVDTGASGIALNRRDAARAGLDPDRLDYTSIFSTANGTTRAAPVTLGTLTVGPFQANSVRASVDEGDLDMSLLGMSYLSTLGRIEIKGDTLVLEAPPAQ
jgi:aspartyl protease family protein